MSDFPVLSLDAGLRIRLNLCLTFAFPTQIVPKEPLLPLHYTMAVGICIRNFTDYT